MFLHSVLPRRLARLSTLASCVVLSFPMGASSWAQTTQLSAVSVTGSREPQPLERLVGDVVVIDAQRLRDSSADSLEDLLRREGGIQLSRTGGAGQTANVYVRGSSASSVVVLVDGVRVGSATLGQADLSTMSLAGLERIEILRGPGSSLYGADAVGGVVHIVTQRGRGAPAFDARLAVGSQASSEAQVGVAGAGGGFDYAANLSREASDGVSALRAGDTFGNYNPDTDGFARRSVQLRGGYSLQPGQRIGLSLTQNRINSQYDSSEYLPPNFAPDATPDFRNRTVQRTSALDHRGAWSPQWATSVQASQQSEDLVAGANAPEEFHTRRRQLTAQAAWKPSGEHQLVGAVERLNESVRATPFTGELERSNTGLVLGYTGALAAHHLQADVRHDRNSVHGNVNTGKLGWRMDLAPGLSVRAVAGTAFRAPSFNDLYYPGYGVDSVRPERSRSLEAGLQWQQEGSSAGLTLYRNRVRDLIGYEPDRTFCPAGAAYDFGCARNVGRARLQGATLTAAHRMGEFGLRATMDWLDAKDLDTGARLARRAAHQSQLEADWRRGDWQLMAAVLAVGARPEGGATLAAYQTLDLQGRYRLAPQWQLEAKLLNAFDRQFEPARDYQAVGRQAWLGVRYQGTGL
jgi:vitamin B12 transporter